jgi:hypothetical protein
LARLERFELPTFWFVARHSIQLSYRRVENDPNNVAVRCDCSKVLTGYPPTTPTLAAADPARPPGVRMLSQCPARTPPWCCGCDFLPFIGALWHGLHSIGPAEQRLRTLAGRLPTLAVNQNFPKPCARSLGVKLADWVLIPSCARGAYRVPFVFA